MLGLVLNWGWVMRKSKILAAVLTLSIASSAAYAGPSPTPAGTAVGTGGAGLLWATFGCSAGIIAAAIAKNYFSNKQLTANEAATCGVTYWAQPQPPIQDFNTLVT